MRPRDPTSSTTDQRAKGRSVSPRGSTVLGWIACDRLAGAGPTALRSWRPTVGPSPSTDRGGGRAVNPLVGLLIRGDRTWRQRRRIRSQLGRWAFFESG